MLLCNHCKYLQYRYWFSCLRNYCHVQADRTSNKQLRFLERNQPPCTPKWMNASQNYRLVTCFWRRFFIGYWLRECVLCIETATRLFVIVERAGLRILDIMVAIRPDDVVLLDVQLPPPFLRPCRHMEFPASLPPKTFVFERWMWFPKTRLIMRFIMDIVVKWGLLFALLQSKTGCRRLARGRWWSSCDNWNNVVNWLLQGGEGILQEISRLLTSTLG